MVNSGSFEPDVDRNEKGEFTQPNRVAESPHSVNCMHSVSGSLCENDFATQTADSLPVSQAIEPTATKTEYKCNMSQLLTIPTIESWESQCNSEGESNVNNISKLDTRETSIILEEKHENVSEGDDLGNKNKIKCNLENNKERTKISIFCSVPLEKVQNVLKSYSVIGSNKKIEKCKTNLDKEMCLYCDRSFSNSSLKQKHVDRYHTLINNRRLSTRRQKLVLQSVTTCMYCDQLNNSDCNLHQLFEHLVTNHSEKYFGCIACKSRFPNYRCYDNHMLNIHNTKLDKKIESLKSSSVSKLEANRRDCIENSNLDKLNVRKANKKCSENEDETVKLGSLVNKIESLDKEFVTSDKQLNKSKRYVKSKSESSNSSSNNNNSKNEKEQLPTEPSQSDTTAEKTTEIKDKRKTRFMKLKNKKVVSTKAAGKPNLRMTRQQSKILENSKNSKRKLKEETNDNPKGNPKYLQFQNKTYSLEFAYKYKKITDHSIDNLKISSMTFDDVFDKAFFNRVKCNIQENLTNFIDGKLFKSVESENRISSFQKTSDFQGDDSVQSYGCKLSSNAVTPVVSLLTDTQFGEDIESQIEYGAKPSKKKTNSLVNNDVHYKYFTRRKYQAVLLENKQHRDLSKLDMWTQLAVKNRQQKIICEQKSEKEIIEYKKSDEYKLKMQVEELDRILEKRGPLEDLKEEAIRSVALEKLNETSVDSNLDNYFDVTMILNEMLNNLFPSDSSVEVNEETVLEEKCIATTSTVQQESSDVPIVSDEIPAMLNLRRVSKGSKQNCGEQNQEEKVELTGEWARSRIYLCASCGVKMPNAKMLMDHKNLFHEQVWSQHYEFVGNQGELYRHLSIPALGKVGELEKSVAQMCRRSDARTCTKCNKRFNCLGDLHRHLLECGGDWSWVLARKKYKYRPYGSKTRKKRRGLLKLLHTLRERKTELNAEKRKTVKKFDGPRPKPSDADTIQRMLANLPPKRITRKIISLKDGFQRKNKNNVKTKNRTQNQSKLNKTKSKLKNDNVLIKSNKPQRLLRSNSDNLFENKFKRGRKKNSTTTITTHSVKTKKRILTNKIVPTNLPENVDKPVTKKEDSSAIKSELNTSNLKKKKNTNENVKSGDSSIREKKITKKISSENLNKTNNVQPSPSNSELEIEEKVKSDPPNTKNEEESSVKTSDKPAGRMKLKKKTKLSSEKNNVKIGPVKANEKSIKKDKVNLQVSKLKPKKLSVKEKLIKKAKSVVKSVAKKKLNNRSANKIVQVDGSSLPFLGKRFKNSVEKSNDETDEPPILESALDVSTETANINQTAPILTEIVDSIISLPIEANNSLSQDSTSNVNLIVNSLKENVTTASAIVTENAAVQSSEISIIDTMNKPLLPPAIATTKGKIKKQRGLNDCIAMLTNKLQDKTSTQQTFNSLFSNSSNDSVVENVVETAVLKDTLVEKSEECNQVTLDCDKNLNNENEKLQEVTSEKDFPVETIAPEETQLEKSEIEVNTCTLSVTLEKLETCQVEEMVRENLALDNNNLKIGEDVVDLLKSNSFILEIENQKLNVLENSAGNPPENCISLKEDNNKPTRNKSVNKPKVKKSLKKSKEFEVQEVLLKIDAEENAEFNLPDEFSNSGKENVKNDGNTVVSKRKKIKNNIKVEKKRRKYTKKLPVVSDQVVLDKTESEPKLLETKENADSDDDLPLSEFAKKVRSGSSNSDAIADESCLDVQENITPEVDLNHIDSINSDQRDNVNPPEESKVVIKYKSNKIKKMAKQGKPGRKPKGLRKKHKTLLDLPPLLSENLLPEGETPTTDLKANLSTKVYDFVSDSEDDSFVLKLGEKIRHIKTLEHKPIQESNPQEQPPNLVEEEVNNSFLSLEDSISQTETDSSVLSKLKVKTRTKVVLKKKGKGVLSKDPNIFCDICVKTFTRPENLFKHKRTLTHIAKLSELEALEAARETTNDEAEPLILDAVVDDIQQESTSGFLNEEASCEKTLEATPCSENDGFKLVELLSDVLNKPVENEFVQANNFAEQILPVDPEVKRCKSLGERKSFDSDKLEIFSPINSPPPLCNGIENHFISKLPSTADIIVEKQISLLENMIEDNRLNFSSSNLASNEEFSNQSNSSVFSMLSSPKQEITFTHNTNIITNLIKPPLNENHLIRNTQYEEISEDSTSSHFRFEEQKSRKVLNRDEELFLECCSLLKSSSEISDLSRKQFKSNHFFSNFGLKPLDEYEWMENKNLRKTSNNFEFTSNNYTSDVSITGNYNDISYSNSNMSNENLNKNDRFISQPPMFEDISTGSASSSGRSVGNVFQNYETISDSCSNDQSKHKFKFFDHRINGDKPADLDPEETKSVVEKESPVIIEDSNSQNEKPQKLTQAFITNFAVPKKLKEEKKVITKGAMKVFEGLKISIPKQDLDMNAILNCSPPSKQQEILNCNQASAQLERKAEEEKIIKVPSIEKLPKSSNKHKQVSRKRSIKDVIKSTGNKLGLKITKKKYLADSFKEKGSKLTDDKKLHDVYDFEETQDNIDAFSKKVDVLPVYHSFKNKLNEEPETKMDNFESEERSVFKSVNNHKNGVKLNRVHSKKINISKSITKKKCMIMGRIFKNAAKTKTTDDVKSIPAIDDSKVVEDLVLDCQQAQPEVHDLPKERKWTEEEMNILFDNLLNEEKPKIIGADKSECDLNLDKMFDQRPKQRGRHKKRPRTESPSSSDEEFSIKKVHKRHMNRKSSGNTECVINLEQELKECIGVASRKSQRKCTSGKQNVLVEYWSSDESSFEVEKHLPNVSLAKVEEKVVEKECLLPSPVIIESEKFIDKEEESNTAPSPIFEIEEKKIRKKPRSKGGNENKNASLEKSQTLVSGRQKRTAVDTLYYWSSSSEDEMQNVIEIKPIREDFNEEDRPLQHGWIVGDSPKKLVTMLAQAKGKKLDAECVKKNKKKVCSS